MSKTPSAKQNAASRVSIKNRFDAWKKDHRRTFLESLQRLLAKPINSMMTWLVIGIALALPVGFYVAIGNVHELSGRFEGNAQISLFMHQRASPQVIERLHQELESWPELMSVKVIGKDQALEEFKAMSGFEDVLRHLQNNPLPVVFELAPSPSWSDAVRAEELLERLKKLPSVDLAQLDLEWVQRLNAMLKVGQRLALGLVILLSLGVLLVIGNTIRLEIENRRDEVIIVKLIGATDSFVRRPFLYTGVFYGLGGGIIASVIVAVGLALLNGPVAMLAGLYESNYVLLGLGFTDMLSLWVMAGFLGFFGAWLSVSQHLDQFEPQ
ncbi:MAG: permease-like cell division protein FtsX [Sinobacterium sp.]|nr:permease-like cell division protein FtsX [Sinobacterium sp.]